MANQVSAAMTSRVIVALLLGIASAHLGAADVNGYQLTSEKELQGAAAADIEKFWNKKAQTATFPGERGLKIAYAKFIQPDKAAEKGAIVISSGRTEAYLKYKELVYDLWRNGYSVYIHDHRGQGLSEREPEVAQTPQRGHVQDFSLFVSDLRTFVQQQAMPGKHNHYFLLAHSMGGAIASLYLEEDADKGLPFRAAALSSPMHQIKGLGGFGAGPVTCTGAHAFVKMGKAAEYMVLGKDYSPKAFDKNEYTFSPVRYARLLDMVKANSGVRLGSPTHGWIATSCDAAQLARNDAAKIKVPLRLFEAGADSIVHSNGHNVFCKNLKKTQPAGCGGKDGGPIVVPGAKHELFIAPDAARNQDLVGILDFFKANQQK
jgi:lysophospholipase